MKKTILHAVLFSTIIHVLIIGVPIVRGYLLTKFYRPNILGTHSNAHMLQNEVAFGVYYDSGGAVLLVLSFLVGVGCFVVGKSAFVRLTTKEV